MKRPQNLNTQLKHSNIELRNYVSELEKEINRLQKHNAKLEVKNISNRSKIKALEKLQPKAPPISIHFTDSYANEGKKDK